MVVLSTHTERPAAAGARRAAGQARGRGGGGKLLLQAESAS